MYDLFMWEWYNLLTVWKWWQYRWRIFVNNHIILLSQHSATEGLFIKVLDFPDLWKATLALLKGYLHWNHFLIYMQKCICPALIIFRDLWNRGSSKLQGPWVDPELGLSSVSNSARSCHVMCSSSGFSLAMLDGPLVWIIVCVRSAAMDWCLIHGQFSHLVSYCQERSTVTRDKMTTEAEWKKECIQK